MGYDIDGGEVSEDLLQPDDIVLVYRNGSSFRATAQSLGAAGSVVKVLAAVMGLDGAPGADGAAGAQGPQGNAGAPGADGAAGAQGPAGNGFTQLARKTTDQTAIGTAYADVTGVGLSVAANTTYRFEFCLICDADATTTGIDVACNGPASPADITYEQLYWTSATARTERGATAYDANTASTASNGAAAKLFYVRGILRNGANVGTLIARVKRENVGSGPNVRAGSYGLSVQLP